MGVTLDAVSEPAAGRRADVLFIHGLEGDARTTWHPAGGADHFWPAWLGEDVPSAGIWTLGYDAPLSTWRSTSSPLIDLASGALSLLEAHRLGSRPLVIVAHSLGGLLTKQMLRQAADYGNPGWEDLHRNISGIVFVATPHTGADAANWLRHTGGLLKTSVSVKELEAHNAQLRDLNLWFRHHIQQIGIPIQVYFEGRATRGVQVVNAASADPGISGVTPIKLDEDHISIAKPESRSSVLYLRTLRFLQDRLPQADDAGAASQIRTFLIADVRGYTGFTTEHGDEAAADLARRFAALATEEVSAREGQVIEIRGDEVLAAFTSTRQALRAALAMQARIAEWRGANPDRQVGVGIGLDAGEAVPVDGGFRGAALNLAARLCSLAGPGEVLASDTIANLARKVDGVAYSERGLAELKGFNDPVRVMEVTPERSPDPAGARVEAAAPEEPSGQTLPIGGFLGSLPGDPLVARDAELAQVLKQVAAVGPHDGRLVLLAGEPGAGKTRLAQEVTVTLHQSRFLVAAGRCFDSQQTVPYFPFIELLSALYAAAPAGLRRDAGTRFPYLGRLLPDELGTTSIDTTGDREDQQRLFRAVTGFIEAIAESTPVALLVDDLHWSDQASLDLLAHLSRHTRNTPVFILGTYRDVELRRRHPLEGVLRGLHRDGLLERVTVRRLDEVGTAGLMAAVLGAAEVSDEVASIVFQHTEGNPFFTREVIHTLLSRGDLKQRDGAWSRKDIGEIEVPESVRLALDERVSGLADETQDLLRAASVLGQRFAFDELEAMTGLDDDAVESALDEAQEAGLIRETSGDEYAFSHALTHQALYADLTGRKRRRLHRAAGEAIEQLPERKRAGRVMELARHFVEADELERALGYTIQAGDRAASLFAQVDAERHYRDALALARDVDDRRREAEAHEKLGQVLAGMARYDEAAQHFEPAAVWYRTAGDLEAAGRATASLGRAHRWRGVPDEGIAWVLPMIELLEPLGPSCSLGQLYVALAHLQFLPGRYSDVLESASRGAEIAQHVGDGTLFADARERYGTALVASDRALEGRQVLKETLPLVEECGDIELLRRITQNLGAAAAYLGDTKEQLHYLQGAVEIAEKIGNPHLISFSLANVASSLMNEGRWAEARLCADRAVALVRSAQRTSDSAFPIQIAGHLMMKQGDWEEARPLLKEALQLAQQTGNDQSRQQILAVVGQLDLLTGRPGAAIERLEGAALEENVDDAVLYTLAQALNEVGSHDRALQFVESARHRAEQNKEVLSLGDILLVHGKILTSLGRVEEGREVLMKALRVTRDVGDLHCEANVLVDMGAQDSRAGDIREARRNVEAALALFERLGARKDAEKARQMLDGLAGELAGSSAS